MYGDNGICNGHILCLCISLLDIIRFRYARHSKKITNTYRNIPHYRALSCVPYSPNKRHYDCHNKYPNGYCAVPGIVQHRTFWLEYFKQSKRISKYGKPYRIVLNEQWTVFTEPSTLIFYPLSSLHCVDEHNSYTFYETTILQMKSTQQNTNERRHTNISAERLYNLFEFEYIYFYILYIFDGYV